MTDAKFVLFVDRSEAGLFRMSERATMTTDLIDRLAAHRTLGGASRRELEWLVARGTLERLETGEVLAAKGESAESLAIVLSGCIVIYVDRGAGLHKGMEWRAGDVTGQLPYSRMVGPPGDTVAREPTEVLAIHRDHLPALIRECHEVTSILVHNMVDRARAFTSGDLHDEKMVSLGRLSAGLAHELNNPASAIERNAAMLGERLEEAERASRALGAARLSDAQLAAVDAVRESCLATPAQGVRSPIEQAEHEAAIADWLDDAGLDSTLADALAETAVTFDALERVAAAVPGPSLEPVLRWAAAGCSVRSLSHDIQQAALRISGLVTAVKGFTHMDQGTGAVPVDVARGIHDTIAVLRSKAQRKSASVTVEVEPDLPPVRGLPGELNQIWANLVDNALDAIASSGRVDVRVGREDARVVVRVVDDGAGIAPAIREQLFDPFFTTKPVGQGTGLGLDIVRRLVRQNDGEISFESRPGRTEFRVELPIAETGGDEGKP